MNYFPSLCSVLHRVCVLTASSMLGLAPALYAADAATLADGQESAVADNTPAVLPVRFTGQHYVSATELHHAAHSELAAYAQTQRQSDLFDAHFSILQYLRNNGYYFAHVGYTFLPDADNPSSVLFTISERQQVLIDTISITGAQSWSDWHDEDISYTIGSPIKGVLRYFGVGELIFRQSDIDNAINTITTSYLLHGYQKVAVGPAQFQWNDAENRVSIQIAVNEGPQYTFQTVNVERDMSDSNMSEAECTAIIARYPVAGMPFHPRYLQSQMASIRHQLFIRGYLSAAVSGSYTFTNAQEVHADIHVTPGPQFIFDNLHIQGNHKTKRGVFEFYTHLLHTGAPIYHNQIERALANLYKLGIFKTVTWDKQITRRDHAHGMVHADILIDVTELPQRYTDLSLGYGSYEQFRAGIEYHNRNIFGYAIEGDVGAHVSVKSQRADANIFWGGYYRRRFFNMHTGYEIREEPSFTSEILDAHIRYREQFSLFDNNRVADPYGMHYKVEQWESQIRYGVELSRAQDVRAGSAVDESSLFLSSFEWALIYDSRNDPFNPSEGMRFRGAAEWSHEIIGSDLDFVLYEATLQNFFSVTRDDQDLFILATHLRLNAYDLRNEQQGIPIQKRLFLGGENTIRSFSRHALGPFDAGGNPLGGLSTALLSIEARFQLSRTYNLSGAVFYDAGLVDADELDFDADIGEGVGIGLRFNLPIGPVRLDVAKNIGATFASDDHLVYHFALGFSF